jgi:SAM-dependent methyltransferase
LDQLVARPCPLCGSTDDSRVFAEANFDPAALGAFAFASRKLPDRMHLRLLVCPTCSLLYSSPVPSGEALHAAYREAAFDSAEEAGFASRTYADLVRAILHRLPDRDGALDVGTGEGAFLSRLLELGFTSVAGVEPSAAPIQAAPGAVRPLIRHGRFHREDFAPDSLRLFTCFQTLEHLEDPLGLCRDALALLKPGGAALFVCHDRRALQARLLGTRSPIFDIEHLQLFSPATGRALLERAGFAEIQTRSVWNRYPLRYWARLLPAPGGIKRQALRRLQGSALGGLPIAMPVGNFALWGFRR